VTFVTVINEDRPDLVLEEVELSPGQIGCRQPQRDAQREAEAGYNPPPLLYLTRATHIATSAFPHSAGDDVRSL
jgi:hypothetical protein